MNARDAQTTKHSLPTGPWRAVLFDFNGVIIDSVAANWTTAQAPAD